VKHKITAICFELHYEISVSSFCEEQTLEYCGGTMI